MKKKKEKKKKKEEKKAIFIPHIIQNETIIGKNLFMISKDARGAYDSYPLCKSRLAIRLDLNVNTDGHAKEHTKTHTCQTELYRAGAVYFVRRKFYFL